MHTKLNSRLEELEEIAKQRRQRMNNAIFSAACRALGNEDVDSLRQFFERVRQGAELSEALANCTPAEIAAIERFNVESKAAALRIKGRSLSKAETNFFTIGPN
jgi:hypothetical protein